MDNPELSNNLQLYDIDQSISQRAIMAKFPHSIMYRGIQILPNSYTFDGKEDYRTFDFQGNEVYNIHNSYDPTGQFSALNELVREVTANRLNRYPEKSRPWQQVFADSITFGHYKCDDQSSDSLLCLIVLPQYKDASRRDALSSQIFYRLPSTKLVELLGLIRSNPQVGENFIQISTNGMAKSMERLPITKVTIVDVDRMIPSSKFDVEPRYLAFNVRYHPSSLQKMDLSAIESYDLDGLPVLNLLPDEQTSQKPTLPVATNDRADLIEASNLADKSLAIKPESEQLYTEKKHIYPLLGFWLSDRDKNIHEVGQGISKRFISDAEMVNRFINTIVSNKQGSGRVNFFHIETSNRDWVIFIKLPVNKDGIVSSCFLGMKVTSQTGIEIQKQMLGSDSVQKMKDLLASLLIGNDIKIEINSLNFDSIAYLKSRGNELIMDSTGNGSHTFDSSIAINHYANIVNHVQLSQKK